MYKVTNLITRHITAGQADLSYKFSDHAVPPIVFDLSAVFAVFYHAKNVVEAKIFFETFRKVCAVTFVISILLHQVWRRLKHM